MKKYVWMIMLLPLVLIFFYGCNEMNQYEKIEGDTYFRYFNQSNTNCVDRCELMSAKLKEQGIPHYVCLGWRDTEYHEWIEDDRGNIYDPSYAHVDKTKYQIDKKKLVK